MLSGAYAGNDDKRVDPTVKVGSVIFAYRQGRVRRLAVIDVERWRTAALQSRRPSRSLRNQEKSRIHAALRRELRLRNGVECRIARATRRGVSARMAIIAGMDMDC